MSEKYGKIFRIKKYLRIKSKYNKIGNAIGCCSRLPVGEGSAEGSAQQLAQVVERAHDGELPPVLLAGDVELKEIELRYSTSFELMTSFGLKVW